MAGYSTSNPPTLESQSIAGLRIWRYSSVDAVTVVRVSGYFTNGFTELGMVAGDLVFVLDNDASPPTGSLCWVVQSDSTTVDISDGVTITGTDSD